MQEKYMKMQQEIILLLCGGCRIAPIAQRYDPNSSVFRKHEAGMQW